MLIDPLAQDLMTLREAAQRLPCLRNGRPVHASTLWRWATSGLRGVILPTTLLGSVRTTTPEALRTFFLVVQERRRKGTPKKELVNVR